MPPVGQQVEEGEGKRSINTILQETSPPIANANDSLYPLLTSLYSLNPGIPVRSEIFGVMVRV